MLYEVTPLTRSPPRVVPLPIMVDPMEGEALISWCHRLGARLGFRPRETAHMLSVDTSDPTWWQRPRPETLLSISRRTGVSTKRVQAMTLLDWKGLSSQITFGQIVGRGTRDLHRPGRTSQFCVVCPQCLVDDREAWFRLDWLTGWATVCPTHGTVFIEICGKCRFPVRMPTLTVQDTPTLGTCPNCGARYCDAPSTNAHPAVVALQEPMFRAMRDGEARFPGLQNMRVVDDGGLCRATLPHDMGCQGWTPPVRTLRSDRRGTQYAAYHLRVVGPGLRPDVDSRLDAPEAFGKMVDHPWDHVQHEERTRGSHAPARSSEDTIVEHLLGRRGRAQKGLHGDKGHLLPARLLSGCRYAATTRRPRQERSNISQDAGHCPLPRG